MKKFNKLVESILTEKIKLIDPKNNKKLSFTWHESDYETIKNINRHNLEYLEQDNEEYVIKGYEQDILSFLKSEGYTEKEIIKTYY